MDDYQKSPAFQNANLLVDLIRLGEGRTFPIYRYWGKAVQGREPSLCPNADHPADLRDRAVLLQYLPAIERLAFGCGSTVGGSKLGKMGKHFSGRKLAQPTPCAAS